MSSSTSPYKPSPLSFGSPRTSPFRRPQSPASPLTVRATTPSSSPTKYQTPQQSPTKSDVARETSEGWVSRGLTPPTRPGPTEATPSPTRTIAFGGADRTFTPANTAYAGGDALSKLNPAQVRELREAFQVLDRDGDGSVGREDVVDMLNNLGQDASPPIISTFFPPGKSQNLTLAQFLTQLSTLLGNMSRPDELLSAFAAFDDNDNGQIDVADLRDTLLHTAPENRNQQPLSRAEIDKVMEGFTGRKTAGKKLGKEDVFRYQEFLAAVTGMGNKDGPQQDQ
ncbi:MAG: hypothetical protein M1823_001485 [Watsoniomyces obsoletus]|nr:MAG: hypothetical protein M1823_001485 [Watsoniomyces obsoletus]